EYRPDPFRLRRSRQSEYCHWRKPWNVLYLQLHRPGVPGNNAIVKITYVRQQRRRGRPEAEYRIFNNRLPGAHRKGKVEVVIVMIAVIERRLEGLIVARLQACRRRPHLRVAVVIPLQIGLLFRFGERADGISRLGLRRRCRHSYITPYRHDAFRSGEAETSVLPRSVDE